MREANAFVSQKEKLIKYINTQKLIEKKCLLKYMQGTRTLWELNEKNTIVQSTELHTRTQNYFVALSKNKKRDAHTKVKIYLKTKGAKRALLGSFWVFPEELLNAT